MTITSELFQDLINEEYYDYTDALEDMMDTTGIDAETLDAIISGQLVPDEDVVDGMLDAFENADVQDVYDFVQLGAATDRGEYDEEDFFDIYDELEEDAYYDDEDYEDEYDDEYYDEYDDDFDEDDYYDYYDDDYIDEYDDEDYLYVEDEGEPLAEELAYSYLPEVESRIDDISGYITEFSINEQVKDELAEIVNYADELFEAGFLPANIYNQCLSFNAEDIDTMAAEFAAMCEHNGVSIETQLFAMRFTLANFHEAGGVDFGAVVGEDIYAAAEFEMSEIEQARNQAAAYRNNQF
jgi:hypothetical protein